MAAGGPAYAEVAAALERHGLRASGGFVPEPGDGVPAAADGRPAAAVVMVGNTGPAMWAAFGAAPEFAWPAARHPLDSWCRRVIGAVAAAFGAAAVYPFEGPPWPPVQRWAMRAEPVTPSPLGLLIHPELGLWHGYRGVLLFAAPVTDLPVRPAAPSPCVPCAARPCLAACPVGAFTAAGYAAAACRDHLRSAAGADCLALGCRARRVCPVAPDRHFAADQASFHMRAFLSDW